MSFNGKAGFIGAGKMGGILVEGLAQGGLLAPDRIIVFDVDAGKTSELNEKYGVKKTGSLEELVKDADILFVCVKPDQFAGISAEPSPARAEATKYARLARVINSSSETIFVFTSVCTTISCIRLSQANRGSQ